MLNVSADNKDGMHITACGSPSELAEEVLALISTIYFDAARANPDAGESFRRLLVMGLTPRSLVWRQPPAGEGVSMVIPIPDKEKGADRA